MIPEIWLSFYLIGGRPTIGYYDIHESKAACIIALESGRKDVPLHKGFCIKVDDAVVTRVPESRREYNSMKGDRDWQIREPQR